MVRTYIRKTTRGVNGNWSTESLHLSQACDNWTTNHPGRAIKEAQVPGLVRAAYEKTATQYIAMKGFMVTGICPFKPDIFDESDFAPSLMSNRPPGTPTSSKPQVCL